MERGYVVSGVLYSILILFMVLLLSFLYNMQNKKTILDKLKAEVVNATNCGSDLVAAKTKIEALETENEVEKTLLISILSSNTTKTLTTEDLSNFEYFLFIIRDSSLNGDMYGVKTLVSYTDLINYTQDNYLTLEGLSNSDLINIYYISDTSLSITTNDTTSYITMYGINSNILTNKIINN